MSDEVKKDDAMQEKEKLDRLNEFGEKFMDAKKYLLSLPLKSSDNIRLAIEYLDNGFLRAREAIWNENEVVEYKLN